MPDLAGPEPDVAITGTVRGKVQGVGFRFSAEWAARRIGVTGWVRNLSDGRVEFFAQATAKQLSEFEAWLAHGPPSARVDAIQVAAVGTDPHLDRFTIR